MSTNPAQLETPDAATTLIPEDFQPHRWSPVTRIAFRLAFTYFTLYCLTNGNATLWSAVPIAGDYVSDFLAKAFLLPAQYLAQHLFHVPPPGNALHPTGSGDTAINWIAALVMLVTALAITILWSIVAERRPHPRPHYQTLLAWLRFLIRLTLGLGMVTYGLFKVLPTQMPAPSLAFLAEPYGFHSPMAILWSFIGINPVYEIICGSAELIAGLLILFRRTALFGALVTAFVVTNVVLYNFCFDVPVKLYSAHLLLLALFVALPDVPALYRFFWLHQPAAPTGVWVPPATRPAFRRATIAFEIVFVLLTLGGTLYGVIPAYRSTLAEERVPAPLRGAWRIESATLQLPNGTPIPHPVLSTPFDKTRPRRPFVELDIDSAESASFRDDSGLNSRFPITYNQAAGTIEFRRPDKSKITYTLTRPDPTHLLLVPTSPDAQTASTLALTLASPPEGYPLLHRGFHWVSENAYQR